MDGVQWLWRGRAGAVWLLLICWLGDSLLIRVISTPPFTAPHHPTHRKYPSRQERQETPLWISLVTYLGYSLLFVFGHLRDFLRKIGVEKSKIKQELPKLRVGWGWGSGTHRDPLTASISTPSPKGLPAVVPRL